MSKKLNKEQQQAVDSTYSKILCLAGAGAGKTATMIERISRLVKEGADPQSILVLTFTNAAGFEMRERYRQSHEGQVVIPEFRTFHAFCYSLLIKDNAVRKALGYSKVPTIAEEGAVKNIEKKAKMQCNIKVSDAKLRGEVSPATKQEEYEIELYKTAVNRLIKQENIITFDVLCYDVAELFVNDDPCIQRHKKQYKYIFVDEFQDTDPKQIRFLNSFKDGDFYFCGDCLQNIYKFRNCSNDTIKLLARDDSWEKIKLFNNYRSTNQICEFANKMSTYAEGEYRIEMKGQRDGVPVKKIGGSNVSWKNVVDIDHVSMLIDMIREHPGEECAVLCRSNREVQYLSSAFDDAGLAYVTGKRNEDAVHILKSVFNNDYMLDWLSTFLTADKYAEYVRLAAQVENPDIRWFATVYGKLPGVNERGKRIVEIRKILKQSTSFVTKAVDILKVLEVKDALLDGCPESNEEVIQYLIEYLESSVSADCYLGTIHSSKGLEYDAVYVMGVNDKQFKLLNEEMLNLYYVAITRAKNRLVVFGI